MAQNTNPARGMRDFLAVDVRRREYVIGIIKDVYQKYGFEPLETPAVENIETLLGKYGEEGNQLIFKILKRGEGAATGAADLALRYDLTVPTARVVANSKNELPKFYKRYQIQPVWRADRPARGRFREFYQCDADVFGSKSMIVEAELCAAVCEILQRLGFSDFIIYLNNRRVLTGLLNAANVPVEKHTETLITLDKLDKIGMQGVVKELIQKGIHPQSADKLAFITKADEMAIKSPEIMPAFEWNESIFSYLASDTEKLLNNKPEQLLDFNVGLKELRSILNFSSKGKAQSRIKLNPHLARGLSYYTGAIMEIVLTNGDFAGSIGGGGRYDNLIGMFSGAEIPACGFSLGLERIIVVMTERGMFPDYLEKSAPDVLVTVWNEETIADALELASELRAVGLRVTVYPEHANASGKQLGKQLKYAAGLGVAAVAIVGDDERANQTVTIKYLETGTQETISRDRLHTDLKI